MGTTLESTAPINAGIIATMPPDDAQAALAYLDDLQRRCASRSTASTNRNYTVGNHTTAAIAQVVDEHFRDYSDCHLARDIHDFMAKYHPSHFGLKQIPSQRTISLHLKNLGSVCNPVRGYVDMS